MARLKGDPIPEFYVARGARARAHNVNTEADRSYRAEGARQRAIRNHFLAIQIEPYLVLGEFVFSFIAAPKEQSPSVVIAFGEP